jgi:hypothetical protein
MMLAMAGRRTLLYLTLIAVLVAAVVVWRLDRPSDGYPDYVKVGSAGSMRAWLQGNGPVRLVTVGPSVLSDPEDWKGAFVNPSSRTYFWGGCITWDRWPSTQVSTVSCLSGGNLAPHSRTPITAGNAGGFLNLTAAGTYRLVLTYWPYPGSDDYTRMKAAFAKLVVPGPVAGPCVHAGHRVRDCKIS